MCARPRDCALPRNSDILGDDLIHIDVRILATAQTAAAGTVQRVLEGRNSQHNVQHGRDSAAASARERRRKLLEGPYGAGHNKGCPIPYEVVVLVPIKRVVFDGH